MDAGAVEAAGRPLTREPPFFIVGSGRSGTTLLQNMLSAHSRLAVTPESHFCARSERISGVAITEDLPDFDSWREGYAGTNHFASLGIPAERWREALERTEERSFRAGLAAIFEIFAQETGKPRIGEKTPGHSYYARWLLEAFPGSRVIALQRDARAVTASMIKTPWRKPWVDPRVSLINRITRLHAVAVDARGWADVNGRVLPDLKRDSRVMIVRYETLVREPETTLCAICDFLGERFEPEMLGTRDTGLRVTPSQLGWNSDWSSWMVEHQSRASSPASDASLEKWREGLSRTEVALIEALAGEAMHRCGYMNFASSRSGRWRARALTAIIERLHRFERRARGRVQRLRHRVEVPILTE